MLKFNKRHQRIQNSNGSNVYYPLEKKAVSYEWWIYVAKIKDKLVFNDYSFSHTTSKHQSQMRNYLSSVNTKIDIFIPAPKGLQDLGNAIDYNTHQFFYCMVKLKKARKTREHWKDGARRHLAAVQFLKGFETGLGAYRFMKVHQKVNELKRATYNG